jgi:SET domain-containing protein
MLVASYISPSAIRGKKSNIEGRGLFAVKPIQKGEVVAIKGGHIINKSTLKKFRKIISNAEIQLNDEFFLAPLEKKEHDRVMMFLNHSCEPNVGVSGQIMYVAMRDIKPGEELTLDYAMIDDASFKMKCRCGTKNCRKIVTGKDWKRKELQKKYGDYFAWFLLQKMKRSRP